MCTNKIKNVLVLGTGSVNVVRFCKLYQAFLSYDSYEEVKIWRPDFPDHLKQNDEMEDDEDPIIFINNLRLICTPDLSDSYISKQIISILSNFEEQQTLSAIIILLKQNEEDNMHLSKLKRVLFGDFKKIEHNILYVYAGQKNVLNMKNKKYFNEETFFALTNWSEDTKFCKSINDYIVGDGNKNGLESVYVRCEISKELMLNLLDNSMQLLIYICLNRVSLFYISGFTRKVTVCYGSQCVNMENDMHYNILIPKMCHCSCSCTDGNTDVTKCIIFETQNETCVQCNCTKECHSHNYFKWTELTEDDTLYCEFAHKEEQIAINILAAFYLFKQQNKQEIDIQAIFIKYVEPKYQNHFNMLGSNINKEINKLQSKSTPVTNKDMLLKLKEIYKIKNSSKIVPKFIEEIFPQDFRFKNACVPTTPQTISESDLPIPHYQVHKQVSSSNSKAQANPAPSKTTKLQGMQNATNMDDIKMEVQTIKNKVAALERTINILISGMDDFKKQILDGKLKQDEQASTSNTALKQDEEDNEER